MGYQHDAWLGALDDRSRALVRLSGRHGQWHWAGTGFFGGTGQVLRDLAAVLLRQSMPAYPA